jgi:hypothetical protein
MNYLSTRILAVPAEINARNVDLFFYLGRKLIVWMSMGALPYTFGILLL